MLTVACKVSNSAWDAGSGSGSWLSDGHTWCTVHSRVVHPHGHAPEYIVVASDDSHLYRIPSTLVLEVERE